MDPDAIVDSLFAHQKEDRLILNVRGSVFEVDMSTLSKLPNSTLAKVRIDLEQIQSYINVFQTLVSISFEFEHTGYTGYMHFYPTLVHCLTQLI